MMTLLKQTTGPCCIFILLLVLNDDIIGTNYRALLYIHPMVSVK